MPNVQIWLTEPEYAQLQKIKRRNKLELDKDAVRFLMEKEVSSW